MGFRKKSQFPRSTRRGGNPYGFSKLVVERMLTDLGYAHGLRSVALRYFNAAGATIPMASSERRAIEGHAQFHVCSVPRVTGQQ